MSGGHARNTLWNLLGQGAPLLVGVVAVPVLVHNLGSARFGVLGLLWALVGYAAIADFGIGRSTIKFVAAALSAGQEQHARTLASLSVVVHAGLGVLGAGALALVAGPLVRVLVPEPALLQPEALGALYLTAASLPFVLVTMAGRAILEAARRFDVANTVRAPASALSFLVPAVAASLGAGLVGIMGAVLVLRVVVSAVTLVAIPRSVPSLAWTTRVRGLRLREVATFSGWVAAANFLNPVFLYFDRFLLGALAGASAVAYYTAPFEVVTRLLIIPGAAATALYPTFSALGADARAHARGSALASRSVGVLAALLVVPTLTAFVFAEPLLDLWLGPDFAREAAPALRLLAAGVLVNGLAHIPYSYLQGTGRPDLPTKLLLIELPFYLVAAWLLVARFGVTGAAAAWSLRVGVDAVLMFGAARVQRTARAASS